jgi:hypothetical protein
MSWVLVVTILAGISNHTEIHYRMPQTYTKATCEREAAYHQTRKNVVEAHCYAEMDGEITE